MKKQAIKLAPAFSLDKATVAKLNDAQMSAIAGGQAAAAADSCGFASCNNNTKQTVVAE